MTAKKAQKAAKKIKSIGAVALELMEKGKTNEQVLAGLKTRFPKSKVSMNSVTWYRSNYRRQGVKLPTNNELSATA